MIIHSARTVIYSAKKITERQTYPDNAIFISEVSYGADLYAEIRKRIDENIAVFVVHADVFLPDYWQQRLIAVLESNVDIDLCSALTTTKSALSPLVSKGQFSGSLQQLDQLVYLLQKPSYFYTETFNDECFLVRNTECLPDRLTSVYVTANNLLVQKKAVDNSLIEVQEVQEIEGQNPFPAHRLSELREKIGDLITPLSKDWWPGLNRKPVLLHITMDWGGGIAKWINEFIEDYSDYNHLILMSAGELKRQRYGERLQLKWCNTEMYPSCEFHLNAPIDSMAIHHSEYQSILQHILQEYSVSGIIVSSFIGHSLNVLTTKLPTLRILHDYFPDWPLLNAQLDKETIESKDYALAYENSCEELFGCWDPQAHQDLVAHLKDIYQQHNIELIAPSESVKRNLLKLRQADTYKSITVIPHTVRRLKPIVYHGDSQQFVILVPGRISSSKGQSLLDVCLDHLAKKGFKFVLLGAGHEGKQYVNRPNVEVIKNYQSHELQAYLEKIQPQLALMTSTASETFSYMLSELQSAAIPTLATKVGALSERIEHGKTGFLSVPKAENLIEQIIDLKSNGVALDAVHKRLLKRNNDELIATETYSKLFSQYHFKASKYSVYPGMGQRTYIYADFYEKASRGKYAYKQQLEKTEQDLNEKTIWAKKLSKHNHHLSDNIALEKAETDRIKKIVDQQKVRFKDETDQLKGVLSDTQQALISHEQQITEQQNELAALYGSRSWRFTRPLRKLTQTLRNIRNRVRYRTRQIMGLPRRLLTSLRTRGVKGTQLVIKNKLKRKQLSTPIVKPQPMTKDYQPIKIPVSQKVRVRIVIPVFNHFQHTYHCLKSIAELPDLTEYEVVVVDDCSTDETTEKIQLVEGIRYIRQKQNGGFINSCNTGAKDCQAEFLLFLNNDTEVHTGWLDTLVETFEQKKDAGLVGSKLVYPDGRLQEAGGIVFSDGSGWNYGRLDDPEKAEYNHLREVSYCSGASILIRTTLFNTLGCFDKRYIPAYYEDTDLAFAVRDAGLKVYYQFASVITHFEGVSSGTDLSSGTKKYQLVNQKKFVDKWQQVLKHQPVPGSDIQHGRFQSGCRKILIMDACTPTPDQDSGSLRMFNLIRIMMGMGYHVSFMPENLSYSDGYTKTLQKQGVECLYAPQYKTPLDYLQAYGYSLDVVFISRYYVASPVITFIAEYAPQAQVVFDTVDLHYLREQRMAELEKSQSLAKTAESTKQKELSIVKQSDVTLVVSPYEQNVLKQEVPGANVQILSNIHQVYGCQKGFHERRDIMFIGGYQHTPNVDGILWFCDEIFPRVKESIDDIQLHIIGSKAPEEVEKLGERKNIQFHGFVENIEPFMQNIRVAVAPLRYGAGVKGKVNMSMSYGQPVVGTEIAVEGMYTTHGVDVLMSDDAEEFAKLIQQLYSDEVLWNTVSEGGIDNVRKWFSFQAAQTQLKAIFSQTKQV